ncbi:hypothetical protein JCM19045_56 [Bacillus sp. JCM 19045]|nr:hypothetical protein JCM19045_56 [Bacillus sp. JCM 19045]
MAIPKFPKVPPLSAKQIQALTTLTFYKDVEPEPVMRYLSLAALIQQLATAPSSL